jgi:hypothetical protein
LVGVRHAVPAPGLALPVTGSDLARPQGGQRLYFGVSEEVLQREPVDLAPLVVMRRAQECRASARPLAVRDLAREEPDHPARSPDGDELVEGQAALLPPLGATGAHSLLVGEVGHLVAVGHQAILAAELRVRARQQQNPDVRIPAEQLQELRLHGAHEPSGDRVFPCPVSGRCECQVHRASPSVRRGEGTRSTAARRRERSGCR